MSQNRKTPATATNESKGFTKTSRNFIHNSSASQRARLLEALRLGPVSTLMARRDLDILHPAARVQELKARGHKIMTHEVIEESQPGHTHRVAHYVLLS
jgi:hypothetical protein